MKIHEESVKNLEFKGIYSITNIKNGKRYIGSTKKSFFSRFKTHFEKLRSNNHASKYLQDSWNKYTIDGFVFEILEIVNENFEEREKHWISFYDCTNREKGYNINPNPQRSPSHNQEVKDKIAQTLREKYASGEIPLNSGNFKKGNPPWNKGKKYKSTDHLKGIKKGTGYRCQAHNKSDELLENPKKDNQQPS